MILEPMGKKERKREREGERERETSKTDCFTLPVHSMCIPVTNTLTGSECTLNQDFKETQNKSLLFLEFYLRRFFNFLVPNRQDFIMYQAEVLFFRPFFWKEVFRFRSRGFFFCLKLPDKRRLFASSESLAFCIKFLRNGAAVG